MSSLSSLCLPASQASLKQRARVEERGGYSRGWGETQRQKNGATRELCTKLEQVEVRKPILLSTYYVPGPDPKAVLLLYDIILTTF